MADRVAGVSDALQGRYALERELGRGGMATVYLATDRELQRRVAVKVLRPELGVALGPERFLREIAIAARLSHPHILSLHDSGGKSVLRRRAWPCVGRTESGSIWRTCAAAR